MNKIRRWQAEGDNIRDPASSAVLQPPIARGLKTYEIVRTMDDP